MYGKPSLHSRSYFARVWQQLLWGSLVALRSPIFCSYFAKHLIEANVVQGSADHQVIVTATVLPYLQMTIDNTAIDFGVLNLWNENIASSTTDIEVDSNAQDGFNVIASYDQLRHTDTTTTIAFKLNNGADVSTWENVINQIGYSATAVDTTVSYIANPAANQKSGNYSTTVTYSVTGSF